MALIEILAIVLVFFVLTTFLKTVSNGRRPSRVGHPAAEATNNAMRDFHAPNNAFHSHDHPR